MKPPLKDGPFGTTSNRFGFIETTPAMTKLNPLNYYRDEALIAEVRKRGYLVMEDKFPWERPSEFSRRHGKHPTYLSKRLRQIPGPPDFEADFGKTGRTIRLRSNLELELWMAGR